MIDSEADSDDEPINVPKERKKTKKRKSTHSQAKNEGPENSKEVATSQCISAKVKEATTTKAKKTHLLPVS